MTHSYATVFCTCGHASYDHKSECSKFTSYQINYETCSKCSCAKFIPTASITNTKTSNVYISNEEFTSIIKLLTKAYNTISLNKDILDRFDLQRWLDECWDVLGKYREK